MSSQEAIRSTDSGVGGLTALKEALKRLPNERLTYLGDTACCPYGPWPAEQVVQFTWEMTGFLLKKQIRILVTACNTAMAVASEEVKVALPIPVIDVILPSTRAAVRVAKDNKIGVIDTLGTIKSASYEIVIKSKAPAIEVTSLNHLKFVPIVESNQYRSPVVKKIAAKTPQVLQLKGLGMSILGCIHYPLLRPVIQNVMGNHVTLVDSGAGIIGEASVLLDYFDITHAPEAPTRPHEFHTTGPTRMFKEIASSWLGIENLKTQQVHLGGDEND